MLQLLVVDLLSSEDVHFSQSLGHMRLYMRDCAGLLSCTEAWLILLIGVVQARRAYMFKLNFLIPAQLLLLLLTTPTWEKENHSENEPITFFP